MSSLISPECPLPHGVRAYSTTRSGGGSLPPYDSLNLGTHVGDDALQVLRNRQQLVRMAGLPQMPIWLEQVHGTRVVCLPKDNGEELRADAVYSHTSGQVCAVMTADCLPVLFWSMQGDEVAAAHAGWRGLCMGVLEQTVAQFSAPAATIGAWLGPAIGPRQFEVGAEVRQAFVEQDAAAAQAFVRHDDKYLADIYRLAHMRLSACGLQHIYGGDRCTVTEAAIFYSYRREGITGRMASLIWLI